MSQEQHHLDDGADPYEQDEHNQQRIGLASLLLGLLASPFVIEQQKTDIASVEMIADPSKGKPGFYVKDANNQLVCVIESDAATISMLQQHLARVAPAQKQAQSLDQIAQACSMTAEQLAAKFKVHYSATLTQPAALPYHVVSHALPDPRCAVKPNESAITRG